MDTFGIWPRTQCTRAAVWRTGARTELRRDAGFTLFGDAFREPSASGKLRFRFGDYKANVGQAQEADKLIQASEQQIQVALSNIDGAIAYILEAKDKHPNRIDIVQQSMSGTQQNNNAFARGTNSNSFQAANTTSNAFGVPNQQPTTSAFGAPSQPATTSAFGAPSTGSTSGAFGQPSALGSRPNPFAAPAQSAFGKPAFGASSQPGAGGAFGQPSALGQKSNAFGAPSGGGFSAFANAGTTFGLPSQPATTSAFGQPSQNKSSNAFGAPSQPAPSNPFGAPSAAANPFSGASSTPFGAPSPASKNPFGVPSSQAPAANPFGGSAPKANPFASAPVAAANPFGNPQPNPPAASNPFGRQPNGPIADASPFGNPVSNSAPSYQPITTGNSTQHPQLESYVTFGPNGTLATFKGKRVVYKNGLPGFVREDKTWERIWFPEGPPQLNKDTEMEDSAYDEETKAAYMYVRQHGKFKDGVMPLLPPKREWVLWDF
jgi:nucleoporin NUP42